MSRSLVQLGDLHFGAAADLEIIEGAQELIPDLQPSVIVLGGDLTQRARHGEFQSAKLLVQDLERTAPVLVIPGNHDVQWWRRPLVPFDAPAKYQKYMYYFGSELAPTVELPDVVVTSVLTSHGVAWGSMTSRWLWLKDIGVKGHLRKRDIERVGSYFNTQQPDLLRVLVVHHNVCRGALSERLGLAMWKKAQERVAACGADVVLCGHDHQEATEELGDGVVVVCAGTLSRRSRGGRPPVFNRLCWDDDSTQIEQYRWDPERRCFRRSDVYAYARMRRGPAVRVSARAS